MHTFSAPPTEHVTSAAPASLAPPSVWTLNYWNTSEPISPLLDTTDPLTTLLGIDDDTRRQCYRIGRFLVAASQCSSPYQRWRIVESILPATIDHGTVICGRTALWIHTGLGANVPLDFSHPEGRGVVEQQDVRRHTHSIDEYDIQPRGVTLPCLAHSYAAVETACTATPRHAVTTLITALRCGVTCEQMHHAATTIHIRPGLSTVRTIIDQLSTLDV